jgi:hypothetical protein
MDDNNADFPDLLWSCFINWLNTLEDEGFFKNPIIDNLNGDKNQKRE